MARKKHAHAILAQIATFRSPYDLLDLSSANINRVVTALREMGYIAREASQGRKARFFIRDAFFAEYIRRM